MALTVAVADHMGNALRYKDGLGAADNNVIVQTGDVSAYEKFYLTHSSTGAGASMDVYPSLDGTNYATSPLQLNDLSSTATVPATVIATTAERVFGFKGNFALVRVLQNGASIPTNVCLICSRKSSLG